LSFCSLFRSFCVRKVQLRPGGAPWCALPRTLVSVCVKKVPLSERVRVSWFFLPPTGGASFFVFLCPVVFPFPRRSRLLTFFFLEESGPFLTKTSLSERKSGRSFPAMASHCLRVLFLLPLLDFWGCYAQFAQTTESLSVARYFTSAASWKDTVLFSGGATAASLGGVTTQVDIFRGGFRVGISAISVARARVASIGIAGVIIACGGIQGPPPYVYFDVSISTMSAPEFGRKGSTSQPCRWRI
jgi:hypothetical protein